MTDQATAPWRAVVEVIGPKTVRLSCKHVRQVDREIEARVLLRSSMPCARCAAEGEAK